jgi:hypothetical protein
VLVQFKNENCGSDRALDGHLLNSKGGLIPETQAHVRDFLSSRDEESIIEQMTQIGALEVYVKAMQTSGANGTNRF